VEADAAERLLQLARGDVDLQRKLLRIALLDKMILSTNGVLQIAAQLAKMKSLPGQALMGGLETLCMEVGGGVASSTEEAMAVAGHLSYHIQGLVSRLAADQGMGIWFSPTRGFALYYPRGWRTLETTGRAEYKIEFTDLNDKSSLSLVLSASSAQRSDPGNPAFLASLWQAKLLRAGGKAIGERSALLAGGPAFEGVSVTPKWSGLKRRIYKTKEVVLVVGDVQYWITGQAEDMRYDAIEAILSTCIDSLTTVHGGVGPQGEAARLVRAAYVDIENKEWTAARAKLVRSLELYEASADAHSELAMVYSHSGEDARAETHLRRAIALAPGGAKFHANLAFFLFQKGRFAGAEEQVNAALQIQPNHPSARELLALLRSRK
jgi:hypothetical protein